MRRISLNFLLSLYLLMLLTPTFSMGQSSRIHQAYTEWKFNYIDKMFSSAHGYSSLHTLVDKPPIFIPNIDFVGIGYNIYYGNPLSTEGLDGGYRNFRIAALTYSDDPNESLSADRQYFVPKGVRIMTQQSCSMSFSSKALESSLQYRDKLQVSVGVSANFFVGSFSANAEYNQVREDLESGSSKYVISHAQCIVFQAGLIKDSETESRAAISEEFKQWMKSLNEDLDNDLLFHQAFDEIGTHVVQEIKLGSQFGYVYELKTDEVKNAESKGMKLEVSASIMSVNAGAQTEYQKEQVNNFKKSMASWKSISLGAVPDSSNEVGQWATQAITNPIPVEPQLLPIDQFVDSLRKEDLEVSDKDKLVQSIKSHLTTYCRYLQNTNTNVLC